VPKSERWADLVFFLRRIKEKSQSSLWQRDECSAWNAFTRTSAATARRPVSRKAGRFEPRSQQAHRGPLAPVANARQGEPGPWGPFFQQAAQSRSRNGEPEWTLVKNGSDRFWPQSPPVPR